MRTTRFVLFAIVAAVTAGCAETPAAPPDQPTSSDLASTPATPADATSAPATSTPATVSALLDDSCTWPVHKFIRDLPSDSPHTRNPMMSAINDLGNAVDQEAFGPRKEMWWDTKSRYERIPVDELVVEEVAGSFGHLDDPFAGQLSQDLWWEEERTLVGAVARTVLPLGDTPAEAAAFHAENVDAGVLAGDDGTIPAPPYRIEWPDSSFLLGDDTFEEFGYTEEVQLVPDESGNEWVSIRLAVHWGCWELATSAWAPTSEQAQTVAVNDMIEWLQGMAERGDPTA